MRSTARTRGRPPRPAGPHRHSREHDRIRAAYQYYDSSEAVQRKRDHANPGTRLNAETRWQAIQRTLESLHLSEGFRLLDVGCGTGQDLLRIALEFAELRPSLYGIDLLPGRIEQAHEAVPGATFHVGGAERLPYPSGTFSIVLAATLFSSILDDDMSRDVASEMTRVLSESGMIVCYDMRYPNPWNRHTRAVGLRRLRALFPGAAIRPVPVTLLPPLARRLGVLTLSAYWPLSRWPVLRSHNVAEIRLPVSELADR